MKLSNNPNIPNAPIELTKLLREIANQVNGITEGQGYAFHAARTSAPTTGTWNIGDIVKNSAPAEAGSASSKYVVTGWICTVAGNPGTWLPMRVLTGN